jgi:hypothetical protein
MAMVKRRGDAGHLTPHGLAQHQKLIEFHARSGRSAEDFDD